ncbi:xanthine dehydrogenase family protein molybdopterin-binding subunit [Aquabacterium sp. J223]|uniref:xanthine dehydrogenase family protein molybdopterin-binding subunit n=1 Tax=Aquabacterium sp. J223 TaxID=2898431 RepID=UPI0021AD7BFB|nr:xanthine dehydrogenase family protein molybdopterin-binding subunit [Aquabacterium sp. J223]UUX96447.1 xanthine dehydrogenase family protein molybdopterin-binding subunit [Aquabacterium sp. J223]
MNESDQQHIAERVAAPGHGVGASLRRKEDARFLRGEGQYVGDLRLPGMLEVAFVRSPVAHGRLLAVHKPAGAEHRVFTMDDLRGVQPIRANTTLPGFKPSEQWPLARGKVRQAGEPIAMCVAATRAEAEDLAAEVVVDIEDLPAVVDMLAARDAPPALVHDEWGDNVFLHTHVKDDLAAVKARAAVVVRRQLRTARQSMAPMEGRGVVCQWDTRLEQLVMHSAAQMPHINRAGLSECLGLDQASIRVVSPDVGGGFGYKGILLPEEVCLGWLALQLKRPVRWLEDRREQLVANTNCREHHYDITLYADASGRLLAIDCDATVDSGAYSSYPFAACLEAAQVGSILPGPYVMDAFQCRTWSVATNKPPILPYRGVARTGVCFALEVMLDLVAREAGVPPEQVRLASLVPPEAMPYDNITGKHFDSGDYPQALRRALAALDVDRWRERQRAGEPDGRRIGLGHSIYCEQAAHGTSVYSGWGIPMVPGHEGCNARLTPDGRLELRLGAHSHGQSLETTMAQVAHSTLGIDEADVRLVHGDTALSPYSTGTWGSRCAVMSGGAVATACKTLAQRVLAIGAALLAVPADGLRLGDGAVTDPASGQRLTLAEVAHAWYRQPQRLPAGLDPAGLEVAAGYKARRDTGTFSYAAHACVVAVDTELGTVEILDYVVCEDGGVLLNPMVVDGQILGGLAQGIGTALYEEMPYDAEGQPLASTLADYLLPGATELPPVRIEHLETPSPYTEFGQKGVGEGGAIAPPAAIVNAINDALAPLGAELLECPASPRRVLQALARARRARAGVAA